jgi:hypothetical protein
MRSRQSAFPNADPKSITYQVFDLGLFFDLSFCQVFDLNINLN